MHLMEAGHHEAKTDRDPSLGLHDVGACAFEGLDQRVLDDPFENLFFVFAI